MSCYRPIYRQPSVGASGGSVLPIDNLDSVALAVGTRRLSSSYEGNALEVRRSSDDATQDIGFTADGTIDESALTAFVGANDGYVSKWYFQDGSGNYLAASANSRQPQIVSTGTVQKVNDAVVLVFDGTDDCLFTNASVDLSSSTTASYTAVIQQTTATPVGIVFEFGVASFTAGFGVFINNSTNGALGQAFGASSNFSFRNVLGPNSVPRTYCTSGNFVPSESDNESKLRQRVNGGYSFTSSVSESGTVGTAAFGNRNFFVGARNDANTRAACKISALIVRGSSSTVSEFQQMERLLSKEAGVANEYIADLSAFDLTTQETVDNSGLPQPSTFAETSYTTTATELKIFSESDSYSSFPTLSHGAVYVNGTYDSALTISSQGTGSHTISLSAGSKTVMIRGGIQSRPHVSNPPIGFWIKNITANAPISKTTVTSTGGMVVYGDSITVGQAASPVARDAWVLQVRDAASYPVVVEAWGYRSLNEDAASAGAITAFVNKLATVSPSIVWLAIGTNDYGLEKWSAADFGSAYSDVLDEINSQLPSAEIYAQTPIVRGTETANSFGDTLGDYRSAISTAVGARSYATLVDGSAYLAAGDLADGVHPNDGGHDTYAAKVKTELGIS